MRIRTIKPDFFLDEDLARQPPLERLLFQALWLQADREGRLDDRPAKIKAQALPYDSCDCDEMLNSLAAAGYILRYEVAGRRYIQVRTFEKHQRPNSHEPQSTIPEPPPATGGKGKRKKYVPPPPEDTTRRGYVYFIEAEGGPIKIGFSQNPSARLNDLRCGSPTPFKLVAAIPGTLRQETEWHKRFESQRIDREWFNPSDELRNAIAEATKTTEMHASREGKGKEGERERKGNGKGGVDELARLLAEPEIKALSELWVQELERPGAKVNVGLARAVQRMFAAGYDYSIGADAIMGIKTAHKDSPVKDRYPPRCLARWAAEHNSKPGYVLRPEKVEEIAADYRNHGTARPPGTAIPATVPKPLRERDDRAMTPEELERIRANRAALTAEAAK